MKNIPLVLLLLALAGPAYAQTVTFSLKDDAASGRFFDPVLTAPDSTNKNKLIIRMNSGVVSLKDTAFKASTAAFSYPMAMDTLRFKVTAPAGYYLASITYTQRGIASIIRTGRVIGATQWVVGDTAKDIGTFSTVPGLTQTMSLVGKNLASVSVAITASLTAFATPTSGSAMLQLTGADVKVTLVPK